MYFSSRLLNRRNTMKRLAKSAFGRSFARMQERLPARSSRPSQLAGRGAGHRDAVLALLAGGDALIEELAVIAGHARGHLRRDLRFARTGPEDCQRNQDQKD